MAAVTTALPERAEAGRNYDYRYGWIRDICYIGHAGAAVEGGETVLDDAVRWVCARVLAHGASTAPAYQGDGSPVPEPLSLGLPGYPGGSDVIGNRVRNQFQLDLFGEVLLLLANAASHDRLDADGWDAAELAIRAIAERAEEKEHGIWEIGPDHWTHSRLICVAGLRAIAEYAPLYAPRHQGSVTGRPSAQRGRSHCSASLGSLAALAQTMQRVDASLLLSEIRGAVAPDDPRSVATRLAVIDELCEDDYIYRYAEPGEPLGTERGRLFDLQLLDVLGLPRVWRDDQGGPVLRENAGVVQFERPFLGGVRRCAAAVTRESAPVFRACPLDRDRGGDRARLTCPYQ